MRYHARTKNSTLNSFDNKPTTNSHRPETVTNIFRKRFFDLINRNGDVSIGLFHSILVDNLS